MTEVDGGDGVRVSRKQAKARTRQRLLDAALAVLDEEGESSLTTISVTKRAGLAQPSFYAHFADMDDLLHNLIENLSLERLSSTRSARREWRSMPSDPERFRETYRIPMQHFVAHPQLFRLLTRSQHDRSTPLGDWSRAVMQRSQQALVEDLAASGMPVDTDADLRRTQMVAEAILVLTQSLTMGHLDGRYPDLEEIIDVLVAFSKGFRSLGRSNEELPGA